MYDDSQYKKEKLCEVYHSCIWTFVWGRILFWQSLLCTQEKLSMAERKSNFRSRCCRRCYHHTRVRWRYELALKQSAGAIQLIAKCAVTEPSCIHIVGDVFVPDKRKKKKKKLQVIHSFLIECTSWRSNLPYFMASHFEKFFFVLINYYLNRSAMSFRN